MESSEVSLIVPTINNEAPSENKFAFMDVNEYDQRERILQVECMGCLEDDGDGVLIFDLVLNNVYWPSELFVNGERANIESSDTNNLYMPSPLSALLLPAKDTPLELLMQNLEPKEVQVTYTIFYEDKLKVPGPEEAFLYSLEVTNVDGRDIEPGPSKAKFCLMMARHGKVSFDYGYGFCEFAENYELMKDTTHEGNPEPALPGAIFGLLVLITIGIVVMMGCLLVLAWPKATAPWKRRRMGVLFSPEREVGEEEALPYKGENYRDDVPPPEY